MRILILGLALVFVPAAALAKVSVVATFSILADMVQTVGGDRVAVHTLVGRSGDPHVYQPTPADARAVTEADVVVVNGLGFEGFLERLVEAAGFEGPVIVASRGVEPIAASGDGHHHGSGEGHHEEHQDVAHDEEHHEDVHDDHAHDEEHHEGAHDEHAHDGEHHDDGPDGHEAATAGETPDVHSGEADPHAWQSLAAARSYVRTIAEGLSAVDPQGASVYAANRDAYITQLDALESDLLRALSALPPERRTVVTSHDAFGYFEAAYGIRFLSPQGVSTDSEASARDVAALIRQIDREGIDAVFVESVTDARLMEEIAAETGVRVGGVLFSDSLSGPDGPAPTYLAMMRHNITALMEALAGD